jgi:hypothetical protein
VRKVLPFLSAGLMAIELVGAGAPEQKIVISGADSMILLAQKSAKRFSSS